MSLVTNNGAVCDLPKSFQLDNANNESQDMCGPWSVAELRYAGLPGHGPGGNGQNVDDWAEAEYTKYIGPNTISDQMGSSIENMHEFLHDAGLHYWDIGAIDPNSTGASDLAHIHAALDAGYPVLVTVNELSVFRQDGSRPYPWQPAMGPANHIFTVVGHTSDGMLLVDDELNASDNWPDHYDESKLEFHWASVVQLVGPDANNPWLSPIPSGDPTSWPQGFNAQNFQGGHMVPQGWTWDDKTGTLHTPGADFVLGFAAHVYQKLLAGQWAGFDYPDKPQYYVAQLEASNPELGDGDQIITKMHVLGYPHNPTGSAASLKNTVIEEYVGTELAHTRAEYAAIYAAHQQDTAQITALKAQIAELQSQAGQVPDSVKAAAVTLMRYLGM